MRRIATGLIGFLLLFSVAQIPSVLAWECERPSTTYTIDERTQNATTNYAASVGLGVYITEYLENSLLFGEPRRDILGLRMAATANTRKIISYSIHDWGVHTAYEWHEVSQPVPNWQGDLDNGFGYLYLSNFPVRFYGGPKSAEYSSIWISANGFISFESLTSPTDPYYNRDVPNTANPNTLIAPFWRDLDLSSGGSITWGQAYHWPNPGPYVDVWVISWNNVPNKKNSVQQSFQILIEKSPLDYRQSRIWFQYKQITLDDVTTIGIEDQGGWRGVSYNYLSLNNEKTLLIKQTSNTAYIDYLTIELDENDAYAYTIIDRTPDFIRGHNVELNQTLPEPDPLARYTKAFAGSATLLIDAIDLLAEVPLWVPGVGFIIGASLLIFDGAEEAARQQALAKLLEIDNYHVKARAVDSQPSPATVVDASICITSFWMFTDPNDRDHELTITAKLHYFEVDTNGATVATGTMPTSVTLTMIQEDNDSLDTATSIVIPANIRGSLGSDDQTDYYTFLLSGSMISLNVVMDPDSNCDFDLELYNRYDTLISASRNRGAGLIENITKNYIQVYCLFYVKITRVSGDGWYRLRIYTEPYESDGGGGGGGSGGSGGGYFEAW